ncbi:hypothetical protein Rsub_07053 [Raphidocelis subcapitata]|uniref:Uncharacterized protein n=1 Tax=Raphidocelis subcapitata TaxID=307507 RepID=A0A2V0P4L8_9CHLO|nr:hypothetical protein Rsub_07053 [Raphidocelis subcapitata]|eukprot:GBF94519.1 hypothetical protein Rsub_07053 [Raphidocelis subcapitata]
MICAPRLLALQRAPAGVLNAWQQQQTFEAAACSSSGSDRASVQQRQQQPHQQQQRGLSSSAAAAAAADGGDASSSSSAPAGPSGAAPPAGWEAFFERRGRKKARPGAWRERMPGRGAEGGRYGVLLRERDPELFERMRLVLGYYEQPENAHLPRPAAPRTAHVNNLQTLFFTRDIDPYYKLSLLSYRCKQTNRDLLTGPLQRTAAALDRLEAQAAAYAPELPDASDAGAGGGSAEGGAQGGSGGGAGGGQ